MEQLYLQVNLASSNLKRKKNKNNYLQFKMIMSVHTSLCLTVASFFYVMQKLRKQLQ